MPETLTIVPRFVMYCRSIKVALLCLFLCCLLLPFSVAGLQPLSFLFHDSPDLGLIQEDSLPELFGRMAVSDGTKVKYLKADC